MNIILPYRRITNKMADNIYPVHTVTSVCLLITNPFTRDLREVPGFAPDYRETTMLNLADSP